MNIHYILHERFEGLACIEKWITLNKHQTSVTKTYEKPEFPSEINFDMLIIMGGGMNVEDEDKHPWLSAEKQFIKQAIDEKKIVLGICLGAQLIASVLGRKIYKNKYTEIGWFPVFLEPEAHMHGLDFLPGINMVFHWHGDTFDIPRGAKKLASSRYTPNQAFIYKERVMALQYHYEVDEEAVKKMLTHAGHEIKVGEGIQSSEEILLNLQYVQENNQIMFKLLDYLAEK